MSDRITIVFAYRNRDVDRIKLSLTSLNNQTNKDFDVEFVDYGSTEEFSFKVHDITSMFSFVTYTYLGHSGLLWNKSKALNYGIRNANSNHILTADVDIIFKEDFIDNLQELKQKNVFSVFKIGYLSKETSKEQAQTINFNAIKPSHIGTTFGIGLYHKEALIEVGGLDEFFHFYGAEDEDLNARLQSAKYKKKEYDKLLMYHLWHPRYPQKKDNKLTVYPRLKDILRINQYHFKNNQRLNKVKVNSNDAYLNKHNLEELQKPDYSIKISNQKAAVIHFLEVELPSYTNSVVKLLVFEEEYFNSKKYKLKKLLGKQTLPYLSLKEINDLVLQHIIFKYRDYNYNFWIDKNLKSVNLVIKL